MHPPFGLSVQSPYITKESQLVGKALGFCYSSTTIRSLEGLRHFAGEDKMAKFFKYLAVLVAVIFGLFLAWGWASDIPPEKLAEKYATGASDFLTLPSGDTVHYRLQGNENGPVIVLLHGSNASLHTWEPWVERLETSAFLLSIDLPGHGLTGPIKAAEYDQKSMAKFVKAVTDELEINEFVLVGNSMGGHVAAWFASLYPESLSGLVLVDASGIALPAEASKKQNLPAAFRLAGKWYSDWILKIITPRSLVEEGLAKSFTDQTPITEEMIDRYWELVRRPGNREATAIRFAHYRSNPSYPPAEAINVPTLILWGADDNLIPVEAAYEYHQAIGGSELVVFEGVGHIPMEEIPDESAAAVKDFLARL